MNDTPATVGVVVITHRARRHLAHCLPPVLASPLHPRVLVVNSSSQDGTVELAREMGAETLVIPRAEFNHGATREVARRHIGTDIVVMMTPDAHAMSSDFLEPLVRPLREGVAAVSYARQIPRDGADFFEAFPRHFNYPVTSALRSKEDVARLGSYAVFCSNACAAWVNRALDDVGGFPTVLSLEDTAAVSKLIGAGHRVAYVAEAVVRHSHSYSLVQEFCRYFDIGYARHAMGRAALFGNSDDSYGMKFAGALLTQLMEERPWLIPYALCDLATRYLGYHLGKFGPRFPIWLARTCSSQDYYWVSTHFAMKGAAGNVSKHLSLQE